MGTGAKEHRHGVQSSSTVSEEWKPCDWLEPNKKGPGTAKLTCLSQPLLDSLYGPGPSPLPCLKTFLLCLWIDSTMNSSL